MNNANNRYSKSDNKSSLKELNNNNNSKVVNFYSFSFPLNLI